MVDIDGPFDTMMYIDATEQGKMVSITVFCSFEVALEKASFLRRLKKGEKDNEKYHGQKYI